jgi:hypothetical protein
MYSFLCTKFENSTTFTSLHNSLFGKSTSSGLLILGYLDHSRTMVR